MSARITFFVGILCLALLVVYNAKFDFPTIYNGGDITEVAVSQAVRDSKDALTSRVGMMPNQENVSPVRAMDNQKAQQGQHQQELLAAAAEGGKSGQQDQAFDNTKTLQAKDRFKKPSKPLCEECLAIVQKAPLTDITFVDLSNGHAEHPHMGATDENGVFGYIHDETALRRNPPPLTITEDFVRDECSKRDDDYRMLTERVFVDLEYDARAEEAAKAGTMRRPKLFCALFTIEKYHERIPFNRETWGSKCDGFMVASNKTDVALGTVNIPHEGPEKYSNLWQKIRSLLAYVYDNYYTKYDWFIYGGDDLFLILENLRMYLESEEIQTASNGGIYLPVGDEKMQTPLFMGRRAKFEGRGDDVFITSGAGTTMNKAALKLLVTGFDKFFQHDDGSIEDVLGSRILRNFGVDPYPTQDDEGGERYTPFPPGYHITYRHEQVSWYTRWSINTKEGIEHCARRSISFHYVRAMEQKRLFAILYKKCPV